MVALTVQTLLMMGAAYFVGAALACLIRRSLAAPALHTAERRVDPLPEVVQRQAEAAALARAAPSARAAAPPSPAPPQPVAQPAPAPEPAPPPKPAADDLKRISAIDPLLEAALNAEGVRGYAQMAAWSRADVRRIGQVLGIGTARINQENWIEQAHILAKGGETHYSARRARGETARVVPAGDAGGGTASALQQQDGAMLPRPMARGGVSAVVVMPDAPAAQADVSAPPPAAPVRPAPAPARDNLQRIGIITQQVEHQLNAQGITRYSQIAQWSPSEVERFDAVLQARGAISRENWIEQAQILSRGGDTRFSRDFDRKLAGDGPRPTRLADAIREQQAKTQGAAATDLGSLRSMRTPHGRDQPEPGPLDAQRIASQDRVLKVGTPQDLKRIRGIGVLIEKKLNQLGVTSYDHIANWTAQDIERISQSLDFKGRIERENWIEQARILSAGGHTEFSRRVDRGEVETSRLKA
jgi:predicted flap endonuclease-1-like 5' DNA nuclease